MCKSWLLGDFNRENEDVNKHGAVVGLACKGRARNRMLRKRWIVRNPVVGKDHVTQFDLDTDPNVSRLFCCTCNTYISQMVRTV